jgi:hypothetical protein
MSGLSSPTSSAAASRGKPGSAPSAPTVPAAGCHRRIGCTPRREGSGPPPDDVSRRRLRQGPHAGRVGSRIPGTLLAAAATGRCSCGIGRPRSNRLPASTNHTDIVVWVRFNPGRTLVAGGWEKSVRRWDVATHLARAVLVQPIFEAVPRSELSGAGRSTVRKKAAGKKAATTGQAMK